jgi:lantibiotic modifying enzyme
LLVEFYDMDEIFLKIEQKIWESFHDEGKIGLMDGLSGIALFYNSLFEVFGNEEHHDKLLSIVEKINNLIQEENTSMTLCSGIAGYGIMLLRIKNNIINVDKEYFEAIDLLLQEELNEQTVDNNYDYLHGSMGIAKYFIERYKSTKDSLALEILSKFTKELIEKINYSFDDVVVQSVFSNKHCYYFGLAHGAAGYINFLIDLKRNVPEIEDDIEIPLKAIKVFLNNYKRTNGSKQFYPNLIILEDNSQFDPLISWCQGDLGISNALFNLGLYLNENSISEEALELIRNLEDISLIDSGVKDYTMCHGSIGIILQYDLISQVSDTDFNYSINKWRNILSIQTNDFNEFLTYHNGSYVKETNLITGLAGVGMGELTLKKHISSQWLNIFNLH